MFAHNLRMAREQQGYTQETLAHFAGLHPTEVSRLERALRDPRLTTVVHLAHALEVASADLLLGVDATLGARPPGKVHPLRPRDARAR